MDDVMVDTVWSLEPFKVSSKVLEGTGLLEIDGLDINIK